MLTIKNVKDGGVAYIFGAEYAGVAKALFPQFAQRLLGGAEDQPAVETSKTRLNDIYRKVERSLPDPNKETTTYTRLKGLSHEKAANEIITILYEKMGEAVPQQLRPFYTEVESRLGIQFSRLHKERLRAAKGHAGKYPYRKMDTILLHASREAVLEIAENYTFEG
ncbi:hypothetical protein KM903_04865 [Bacillus glycinifermentans]|uniref:hypothetical protein n=1 Tax=Bacillus glycinifermentans TaxID=1664069 RepID=UPI001C2227FC|nr:hypothetical protein [Bacillus glycinifermentans]MBU8785743.1 hypothetical protein [Bacillus glycinifermentans]